MKAKLFFLVWISVLLVACRSPYQVVAVSGTIVEINETYDNHPDAKMQAMLQTYKTQLDNEMKEVIATSSQLMDYGQPESLLTNFTSDVMKAYGDEHLPTGADVALMNVNGHRANMPKGKVMVGNMYEIYSFDNTITFLELSGENLMKIFESYAHLGGAGVSKNVKLVIEDRQVNSVTVDGKPIDKNRIYHIVTLDYLAEGNNGMKALKQGKNVVNTGITLRDLMTDYVREQTRRGEELTSVLDGRITIIQ